jgi:Rab5 GDP/GTP exchange factor
MTPEDIQKLSLSSPQSQDPFSNDAEHLDVPPRPPAKDDMYIDPTPKTPQAPRSPLNIPADFIEKELPDVPGSDDNPDPPKEEPECRRSEDSQSEIQSIMGQFLDENKGLNKDEIMSPRLELAEQFLAPQSPFPPRRSSLDPLNTTDSPVSLGPSSGSHHAASPALSLKHLPYSSAPDGALTPRSSVSLTSRLPPEPEPEQPFDFHRFLEQLRHRTADPVAKFLRSFLTEFGKKQWLAHEQVKIISDFLAFITIKMAQCEVWRHVSDFEFDNAKEGMEKLVMNRLYTQTFSPAIPPQPTLPRSASKSKRRELERLHGSSRRGQHQEDVERDEILAQKIRIYSWIREEHLDIPPVGNNGRRFLSLAQQGK